MHSGSGGRPIYINNRMGTEDFLTQLLGVMSAVKINVPHG